MCDCMYCINDIEEVNKKILEWEKEKQILEDRGITQGSMCSTNVDEIDYACITSEIDYAKYYLEEMSKPENAKKL